MTIVVDSGRHSGTKDTLSIQLHGASKRTSFISLGSNFISNEERKIELDGLIDVGKVEMISITTSGRDAVLLKAFMSKILHHKKELVLQKIRLKFQRTADWIRGDNSVR